MDWWHLIYILPAIFSAAVIAANLLPVERSSRHNTLFLFLTGIVVFALPQEIQVCLALCLPVAYLHKFFGVSISGIEKMDYGVRKIPVMVTSVRARVTPTKVRSFLTRSYPNPEEEEPQETIELEVEEPQTFTKIRKFVPEL